MTKRLRLWKKTFTISVFLMAGNFGDHNPLGWDFRESEHVKRGCSGIIRLSTAALCFTLPQPQKSSPPLVIHGNIPRGRSLKPTSHLAPGLPHTETLKPRRSHASTPHPQTIRLISFFTHHSPTHIRFLYFRYLLDQDTICHYRHPPLSCRRF